MKVHYIHSETPEQFDENVNKFIKGKKIIDIKPYPLIDTNSNFSLFYLDCVVCVEDD